MLAKHYGFTAEELDFIVNYDIKYRLGRDTRVTQSRGCGDFRADTTAQPG